MYDSISPVQLSDGIQFTQFSAVSVLGHTLLGA